LTASAIASASSDYLKGKNPRWLHLPYSGGVLEFSIHNRFRIAKDDFSEACRDIDHSLDGAAKDHLRRWVGRRYLRSAFPDAFNQRLDSSTGLAKFEKSQLAKNVSVILFCTVDDELDDDVPYPLKVLVGISDDISVEDREKLARAITNGLSVAGINLIDLRIATEDEITYRDLRSYRRLDRDYRSLPEQENVSSPPAGIDAM